MARGLPFIPPLPFHFLITSPLPSLAGAQTRLSPPLFHLPLLPTLPCGAQAWPRGDRKWVFATVISLPLPSLFAPRLRAHTLGTGHRSLQAPWVCWGNYSPFWSPPSPLASDHWSTLSGPSSIIPILPHSGSHHSASGVCPRLTSLLQPISRRIIFLPLVRGGTIGTSRCHSVSHLSQRRRQEDGGRDQGAYWLSVCSSQTGSMSERNHPSSRLHALFVSPSSQSLSAQLLIISPTWTDSDVCVCL